MNETQKAFKPLKTNINILILLMLNRSPVSFLLVYLNPNICKTKSNILFHTNIHTTHVFLPFTCNNKIFFQQIF